eukprot:2960-Pyramimonas_sp.AAC.1
MPVCTSLGSPPYLPRHSAGTSGSPPRRRPRAPRGRLAGAPRSLTRDRPSRHSYSPTTKGS